MGVDYYNCVGCDAGVCDADDYRRCEGCAGYAHLECADARGTHKVFPNVNKCKDSDALWFCESCYSGKPDDIVALALIELVRRCNAADGPVRTTWDEMTAWARRHVLTKYDKWKAEQIRTRPYACCVFEGVFYYDEDMRPPAKRTRMEDPPSPAHPPDSE